MKNILLIILFVLTILSTGCKTVRDILNEQKVSSAEEQKLALETNDSNLKTLDNCDFAFNLSKNDFDSLLIPGMNKIISGGSFKYVKSHTLSHVRTVLKSEQIDLSADFQIALDTMNAGMKGQLIGTIAFAIRNDSLILFPAFKYVHIDDLSFEKIGRFERDVVASFFSLVIKGFIGKLNGYMISKISPVPLNLVDRKISGRELSSDPKTKITLSDSLKISMPIALAACLIDKKGIQILGSFKNNNVGNPVPDPVSFDLFSKNFAGLKNRCFPGLPDDTTYLILSKAAVAGIFDSALEDEIITINYASDNFLSDKSDKNINIDLNEIHCGDVHFDCPALHIVPNCDCPVDFHCSGGPFGVACRVGEAAAKATWYSTVYPPCNSAKLAELAANVSIQAQCATARVAAMGACETTKTSLSVVLTSKVSIGDIHTTVSSSGTVAGIIKGIHLNSDLSNIRLTVGASADAPLQTTFSFTPQGPVGHLVCFLSFDHPYNCAASASKEFFTDSASASFEKAADSSLLIKFNTDPIDFDIHVSPTPLTLMARDIPVLINCPLLKFGIGLAAIAKGFNDIFSDGNFGNNVVNAVCNGKYNYTMKGKTFHLPIKTVYVKYFDRKIPLYPVAKTTYIGFFCNAEAKHD